MFQGATGLLRTRKGDIGRVKAAEQTLARAAVVENRAYRLSFEDHPFHVAGKSMHLHSSNGLSAAIITFNPSYWPIYEAKCFFERPGKHFAGTAIAKGQHVQWRGRLLAQWRRKTAAKFLHPFARPGLNRQGNQPSRLGGWRATGNRARICSK